MAGATRSAKSPFVRVAVELLEDRTAPALFNALTPVTFSGLSNNGCVATGDIDKDGNTDAVLSSYGPQGSPSNRVVVLYGNGAGGFSKSVELTTGSTNTSFVATGDVNNDTWPDVLATSGNQQNTGAVTVFLNDKAGNLAPFGSPFSANGNNTSCVVLADVTKDGKLDAVVASFGRESGDNVVGQNVCVFQGNGDGTFSLITVIAPEIQFIPIAVAVDDLDGDGILDIAAAVPGVPPDFGQPYPDGVVYVFKGTGSGAFDTSNFKIAPSGGKFPVAITARDMTGDGKPDLAVANVGDPLATPEFAGNSVGVLVNAGTLNFIGSSLTANTHGTFAVAAEDFDGDGKVDLASINYGTYLSGSTDAFVSVYTGNGTGTFTPAVPVATFDTKTGSGGGQYLAVGDFDKNGTPDLVVAHETSKVGVLLNTSVPAAATTTALTVTPASPGTYGDAVTLTAAVTTASGVPTGTVTFLNGSIVIGTAPLANVGGQQVATLTFANPNLLAAGSYSLTARYEGAAGFAKSTSTPAVAYTVNKAATTTTLAVAPPNPVAPGTGLTFTATVAGPGLPQGFVAFFKGDAILGQGMLVDSGGQMKATFAMSSAGWAVGDYVITAKYGANQNWLGDDSDPYTLTISSAAPTPAANTTITISSATPSPSLASQAVTITARVAATAGLPTGTVQFFADGQLLGSANLVPGPGGQEATFAVSTLALGAHTLTASYLGVAGAFNPSQSAPVAHTVDPIGTTVFVTSSGSPSLVTQPVTFTAVVGSQFGPATGTVTFWDGGVQIGSAALATVGGQQVATFVGTLGEGTHAVTAKFAAQGNFAPSESAPVTQQVNKVGTATTVSTSLNPASEGEAVTLTAAVAGAVPIAAGPTGAVTFFDGATAIGTANLVNGVASITVVLAPGTHTITASYPGDGNFTPSGAAALSQVVNPAVPPPPPRPSPELIGFREFAVGAGAGMPAMGRFFNPDGTERFSLNLFPGLTGGVRVTSADFNGDGVADLVAGTGPGSASQLRVLDGKTKAELFQTAPFEATFVGGIYVASGDVTGDGIPDIVVSPDEGGGPRIQVYSGAGFVKVDDFFGIDDTNFRGGARAGIGDLDGDGVGDLVVSAGFGGGPRVAAFDGLTLGSSARLKLFADFFAFEDTLRNGAFVAAGDLNGDGLADLIAGGGPGGGPRITAFNGGQLLGNRAVPIANFFGGDVNNRGGVRVAARDLDGDDLTDLVVGDGTGAGSRVTAYAGKSILVSSPPPELFAFDAYPGFTGGVYVG